MITQYCKAFIMLVLRLVTLILLVSCSLGFGVQYWDTRERAISDEYSCDDSSSESNSEEGIQIHRIAELKNAETLPDCPPGESLMSRKDIIAMINHLQSELNIINNINKTYFAKAGNVSGKHLHSLIELQRRLETRPEHLKHILDDIDDNRMKLEPIVNALVTKMQEYNIYEEKFFNVNKRVQKVLESLVKYKQLCNFNNCGEKMKQNDNPHKERILRTVSVEDYYCTTLEDLHKRIRANLTTFQHDYLDVVMKRINSDDQMYATKINNISSRVKESALSMFGVTMYEILTLQDDYHHYAADLNNKAEVTAEFNKIRKNTMEVEFKLIELEEGVEKYHQYCLNCNPISRQAFLLKLVTKNPEKKLTPFGTTLLNKGTDGPSPKEIESLNIDDLVIEKLDGYKQKIDNDYRNIFAGLDTVVNDPTLIDSYVKKLKPVQDMVRSELVKRQEALANLKSKIPQWMVEQVYELSMKSKQLLAGVQSAIDFVKKYI